MERSKWVAILTGIVAVLLGIGYLGLVQLLDFRGNLQPAPLEVLFTSPGPLAFFQITLS